MIWQNLDNAGFEFLNRWTEISPALNALIVFCAAWLPYALIATFLLLLYRAGIPRRRKIRMLLVAVFSALAATWVKDFIRLFWQRQRPFWSLPAAHKLLTNDWFYSDRSLSFPSGHAAVFFAVATAVFLYNKRWGAWFFAGAVAINLCRVIAGVHYPSDIIAGAAVGTASAAAVRYLFGRFTGILQPHE